ncbi:hypothetical protein Scep_023792 [Stephania cephalantha]|uniref:Uncharacterized protein n=1 Tax=Stephania cephalantha TaxID=152367 RepID=A0AAP0HWK3_9MAGN
MVSEPREREPVREVKRERERENRGESVTSGWRLPPASLVRSPARAEAAVS